VAELQEGGVGAAKLGAAQAWLRVRVRVRVKGEGEGEG